MSKQTICLLNDSFPPMIDGVANTVVNYAKNIEANHGHAIVVTPSVKGAVDEGYTYPVLRYPSIDTRKIVGYVAGYPFSPDTMRRLQGDHTALLHTHCPAMSTVLARELRSVLGAPVVLTYHTKFDVDIAKAVKSRILQGGAVKGLVQNVAACDEVWVVSEGAGKNLRSLGYEGSYSVMQNGVDVPRGCVSDELVAAATAGYDLPRGVPMFLFVGRMMWYKGLRIILDALAMLKQSGVDFRMVFVGDGRDGAEVRDYTAELKLDDCCMFTGAIADRETIRAWYTRADVFLFPSTYDTNGLVVREAAASATATIMVEGSCAAEGVTDGQNGFFIQENADSLAAKLRELCAAPEMMRRVGEHAQSELYLSWEDAVARAYERYEVIIDDYRSGKYPKHRKPLDGFFASQGELMDAFALIDEMGDEMRDGLVSGGEELLARFRSGGARLRAGKERINQEIDRIWSKMDRYL